MAIASTYPLDTSDGAETYLGLNSSAIVKRYPKPATQSLMETRTAAMAANISVAVKSLRTAGYANPGDLGDGLYRRLATAPLFPTNPGYFRSVDRFTADGSTDNTNGGWWKLAWDGPLRLEQFGGKADFYLGDLDAPLVGNPTPTDNLAPFTFTKDFIFAHYGGGAGPTIQFDYGTYYFSDAIVLASGVCLRGMGAGYYHNVANSRLKFAAGKKGIVVNAGGGSSVIRDLFIESLGRAGQTDKHGIELNFAVEISHCSIVNFGGSGVSIYADFNAGTNANCWYVNHCAIYGNAAHGVHCQGADSNAGIGSALSIMSNDGWGVYDIGYLGNIWVGCHESYNLTGPYFLNGINAKSVAIGCYNEGYSIPSYCGPYCNFIGGTLASGLTVADGGGLIVGDQITAHVILPVRPTDVLHVKMRGHDTANQIMLVDTPTGSHVWGYDTVWKVFNLFGGCFTTDANTPVTAGRPESLFHAAQGFSGGMWLGGDSRNNSYNDMRFFGNMRWDRWGGGFRPGTYGQGDTILNALFAGGNHWAWVCTQAGAVGPDWAAGINYAWYTDERSAVVKNAGHYYRIVNETLGTETLSVNAPTHTSGTATGVTDGHTWQYLTDTTAQFRKLGVLDQPTVTGSRGGNAALASLITALAASGVIVDGTTA